MTDQIHDQVKTPVVEAKSNDAQSVGRKPDPLVPTIYHEPWWLEIASQGTYRDVEVRSGDRCVARMPFLLSKSRGLGLIGMPMFTHFLGPALDVEAGKETTRRLKSISLTKELIENLPNASSVWFRLHHGITDTLGFQALGFQAGVQFTSVVAPAPEQQLWSQLRDTTRRVIRRAQETLRLEETLDPDEFMSLYENNLAAHGRQNTYDPIIARKLLAEALRRGVGRMLLASNGSERKAGVFTIWDDNTEYYLLTTRSPDSDNGAISMLIWEAVRHAASNGIAFDFDGLNPAGDIRFYLGFGGSLQPRYLVWRSTKTFQLVRQLTRFVPVREAAIGM